MFFDKNKDKKKNTNAGKDEGVNAGTDPGLDTGTDAGIGPAADDPDPDASPVRSRRRTKQWNRTRSSLHL